ncbi:MAG: hypothetical protein U1G08_10655 [Verrucomicrobiota bacterium]
MNRTPQSCGFPHTQCVRPGIAIQAGRGSVASASHAPTARRSPVPADELEQSRLTLLQDIFWSLLASASLGALGWAIFG